MDPIDSSNSDGSTTMAVQNLLLQIRQGENLESVKEQLIERAYSRLRLLARRMLNSYDRSKLDEETDGLVAEAYLRLNRSLEELQPESIREFFALAALQMRRHLLDKLRQIHGRGIEKRPKVSSLEADAADSQALQLGLGEAEALPSWTAIDILEALDKLGERERECLVMQHWFGFSHDEIATVLAVSTKTVQRSSNLAFIQLREILKSYSFDAQDKEAKLD